jgi:Flp pilus assembly protein TadG
MVSTIEVRRFVVSLYGLLNRDIRGQAMIETAVALPVMMWLAFNTVNFGYFFLMAINLAAAPRTGALYSILGGATPANPVLPTAAAVNTLTTGDLTGAVYGGSTAPVQVCSPRVGTSGSGSSLITTCAPFNGFTTTTPPPDPEAPNFVLNQVDVRYTFTPIIDKAIFNLLLLATPYCSSGGTVTCTFHRKTLMRAMN